MPPPPPPPQGNFEIWGRSTLFIHANLFNKQLVSNRGVSLYSNNRMVNNKIQIIKLLITYIEVITLSITWNY